MITKEQIEKASKEWAIKHSNAPDKDTPDWIECDFKGGANWALEQCPYSRKDMMSFATFCVHQFNVCDSFDNWYHEWGEKEDTKTTQQLLNEWEEQKNG